MPTATLEEVQRLADELSPLDQVRLLHHLLPHIAQAVASAQSAVLPPSATSARSWEEFFRLGDELVRQDAPEMETLTATLLSMRR
jgi:hypothetical protein